MPGDYSTSSTHSNTDFGSVLDEITNSYHVNAIEPPTNNTASNSPLLAFPNEIVKLETLYDGAPTADQFKSEWESFITQLKTSYPNNIADIESLDQVTASITDVAGWEQFIDLLKTKVDTYLYPDGNSDDATAPTDPVTAPTDPATGADPSTGDATSDSTADDHSNEWHEDDVTTDASTADPSTDDNTTDPTTDDSTTDPTTGDSTTDSTTGDSTADSTTGDVSTGNSTTTDTNSSGNASDSFNDYVTLQDLDNELNNKLDAFSTKILSEIQDLLKQNGFSASVNNDPTVPTSAHNNQATW